MLCVSGLCRAQNTANASSAVILVLGDSLSAEYGLERSTGWVALMEQRLKAEKSPTRVVNASISGETTAGGRSRLSVLLQKHQPTLVIIELGGNDALRGLPLQSTADNLTSMVQMAKANKAKVLLVGMQVPPNYGQSYTRDFAKIFKDVARTQKVALVPFFLKGIADAPNALEWFQGDRIHPNKAAQPLMLNNVWGEVKKGTSR